MSHFRWWVTLTVILGAAGCTPPPEKARYTVEQYRADRALRKIQFSRCTSDPGTLGKTPDCINALQAEKLEGMGSFKDLPPMQLPR